MWETFTNSPWSGGLWPEVWVNRAVRPRNLPYGPIAPNPMNPLLYDPSPAHNYLGVEYSSTRIANAATEAMTLRMLGAAPSVWEAPLVAAGLRVDPVGGPSADVYSYTDISNNPGKYYNFKLPPNSADELHYVVVDKMILYDQPEWVFSHQGGSIPTGVMIDYEVNDFRANAAATPFLVNLAADIHNQGFVNSHGVTVHPLAYLYTNPWNGPWDGALGGNSFDFLTIDQIKSSYDYISLYPLDLSFNCSMSGANSAYQNALNFLSGVSGVINFSQLIFTFDLYRCSSNDAITMHNLRETKGIAGYDIFDKGQALGGAATPLIGSNLQIWNLLYGTSTPPPNHRR